MALLSILKWWIFYFIVMNIITSLSDKYVIFWTDRWFSVTARLGLVVNVNPPQMQSSPYANIFSTAGRLAHVCFLTLNSRPSLHLVSKQIKFSRSHYFFFILYNYITVITAIILNFIFNIKVVKKCLLN